MAGANGNVEMMVSVLPGTMTGFASLNAGLASINNSFLNMTQAISDNFGLVETAVITTGVVIAQTAADAASAFGDFEQSMKIVQMVSGQTSDQVAQLGQAANQFSVQYRMDIDQITEGLQTLGRAGLNSASEQTEVLKSGLNTAKLEGRDLNDVLEELIQNTALLGGDLKSDQFGEQSEYLNNVMVATSLSAPITTHDVSETLKYSGGIAAAAGASVKTQEGKALLEDYMGTIAAFAQKGVTGSIAGTALRAFFNKPATQDSSVLEGLATIKLKPEYLWEDDQETMKPISEQIGIIQKQMDKLNIPTMDRLQIWSKIVGGKMGQQMMKLDSSDIKNLTHDIQDAQAAEDLANKSMQTYNANVNQLGQRGQAFFRDFGSKIVFFVNPVLDTINKIMDAMGKLFGGFGTDVASSALFLVLLAFMRKFVSLVRQTVSGLRQGLASIYQDYKAGNKYTIRDYRGDKGRVVIGQDGRYYQGIPVSSAKTDEYLRASPSTKDFLGKWATTQAWRDFQAGKLTPNQYGVIAKTANWNARQIFPKDRFPALKVSDKQIMETLARRGYLQNRHISAIQEMSGKDGKSQFLSKYGNDMRNLYLQYLKDTQAIQQNAAAQQEHDSATQQDTNATKQNTNAQREHAAALNAMNKAFGGKNAYTKTSGADATTNAMQKAMQAKAVKAMEKTFAVPPTSTFTRNSYYTTPWQNSRDYKSWAENYARAIKNMPSEHMGASQFVSQKDVGRFYRNGMFYTYPISNMSMADYQREVNKATVLNRNKQNSNLTTQDYYRGAGSLIRGGDISTLLIQIENEILRIKEQELALEQQMANQKKASQKPSEHVGSKGFVTSKEGKKIQDKSKAQYQINQTKQNMSDSVVKTKDMNSSFVETKNAAQSMKYAFTDAEKTMLRGANAWRGVSVGLDQEYKKQAQNVSPVHSGMFYANQPTQTEAAKKGAKEGVIASLKSSILGSRQGRAIDFKPQNFTGLSKAARMTGNAFMNVTDMLGGPVMIGFMLLQIAIGQVQQAFQEFCAELKDAEQAVDDAYSKVEQADKDLEETYTENNPGATQEDIDTFMGDVYIQMEEDMRNGSFTQKASQGMKYPQYEENTEADDGSMKEKEQEELSYEDAVKENTSALYAATAELRMATDQLVSKMNDKTWGIDGFSSEFSDDMGEFVDKMGGYSDGSQFSEEGTFLKTASQKDENYAGYTELAGLMLEDLHDAEGNWEKGFATLLGSKDGKAIASTFNPSTRAMMDSFGGFAKGLSRADNSRLQSSMKRNKRDWQALAKEIAKQEKKTGKLPGKSDTGNKRIEKLISKLATETGLDRLKILQAQSLQAMQDMYEIAQTAIVPTISTEADIAASHYQLATNGINPSSNEAAYGAQSTAAIAQSIAAMVAIIAQAKAVEAAWQKGILAGDADAISANSAEEYLKKGVGQKFDLNLGGVLEPIRNTAGALYETFGGSKTDFNNYWDAARKVAGLENNSVTLGRWGQNDKILDNIYTTFDMMGEMRRNPTWTEDQAYESAKRKLSAYKDGDHYTATPENMFKMLRENYADAVAPAILDAYLASGIGEDDEGSGGGGGGGSGGGSDKDDDKKSKKERVDLVLCNKKEIPKLNVNLFKKPPSFTVLNKNFKLRDIKVNTQDKPKAVLSSIKNAIIDVQKRSDPKIIQDEAAEYDPAGATDGNSVPSGSTNTSTT